METILQICEKGNSADRQRRIYSQSQNLEEVVRHNTKEFETGNPIY
jgi:gamma-glutamyl:cysteine ligase YbdK (ATP-grasp superfamily)